MPGKSGRKGAGGRDSTSIPFHSILNGALVAGGVSVAASPVGLSARAGTEADAWAHFRIKRLAFRQLPTSPITGIQVCGFIGGVQDTPPANVSDAAELLPSCVKGIGQTVPTEWVRVSSGDLAGPFPWYKSIAGTADSTEESPGTIILRGTGTDTFTIELRGIFEFKTSVATANTPAMVQLRSKVREERLASMTSQERAVLLKILGASGAVTPLLKS